MVGSTTFIKESLNNTTFKTSQNWGDFMAQNSFTSELKPIGECILTLPIKHIVPEHQRDYSWDKETIEFWADLIDYIKEENYFFGSMVFQKTGKDDELFVLDGQQRLATITILFAVIRDLAKDFDDKFSNNIHNNYIVRELEDDKTEKLILNLKNRNLFLNCIQKEKGKGKKEFSEYEHELKKVKSNRLIRKAYEYFEAKIMEELNKKSKKEEKIEYLKNLIGLRKRFLVIKTVVGSEDDAYLLFETINERGLELSVADLFKNHLIREAQKDKRDAIIESWNIISKSLDDKIRNFLKHYWHSKVGVITERRLFREFKSYVKKNKMDINDFVEELKKEADIYSKFIEVNKSDWDNDSEITEILKDFRKLGTNQVYPLLLIAKNKFEKIEEFKKLLKAIINFTVRYIIICGKAENVLETRYSNIAKNVRYDKDGEGKPNPNYIKDTKGVIEQLKDLYPKDEEFKKKFLSFTTERNPTAWYLLKEIDKSLSSGEMLDYSIVTVEHILPEKPDKEWKDFFKKHGIKEKDVLDYMDELKYRIGNLTILGAEYNKKAKNKFFIKKRDEEYKKSTLVINQDLKILKKWDSKEIEKKEKRFSELAPTIWKIDF